MDAFGTAHRAQASTHGVIKFAQGRRGGPLLMAELDALAQRARQSRRAAARHRRRHQGLDQARSCWPRSVKVDQLIVGGGIANTFLAAIGHAWASRCASRT
jgi:phosphoglycerate kinase